MPSHSGVRLGYGLATKQGVGGRFSLYHTTRLYY